MPSHLRVVAVGLALVLASACQAPTPAAPAAEGGVSVDRGRGTATVKLAGRTFRLDLGGQAVTLLIGGVAYPVGPDGKLALPGEALAAAKARGSFTILAPGAAPRAVSLTAPDEVIALTPAAALGLPVRLPAAGGEVAADGVGATFPAGMIGGTAASAALSTYVPAAGGQADDLRVGLYVRVDGRLGKGELAVAYDLAVWQAGGDPARAAAARRLTEGWARLPADERAALERKHGIRLDGGTLRFPVRLGDQAVAEGATVVEVDGLAALGVYLEVTVVSTAGGKLPADLLAPPPGAAGARLAALGIAAPLPGLITDNGAGVVGQNGGNIISDLGGGVVSNNGGGVVSNNGGNLHGDVRVPFEPRLAKYRLRAYVDYRWPYAQVTPIKADGTPYMPATTADVTGAYAIAGLPPTEPYLWLDVAAEGYRVATMAKAPGATAVVADVDAATTAIADWVRDDCRLRPMTMAQIDPAGFAADVAWARGVLTQAEAEWIAKHDYKAVAAFTRKLFLTHKATYQPKAIPFVAGVFAVPGRPSNVVHLTDGTLWVLKLNDVFGGPGQSDTVLRYQPDGTPIAEFRAGPVGCGLWAGTALPAGGGLITARMAGLVLDMAADGTPRATYNVGGNPAGITRAPGGFWVGRLFQDFAFFAGGGAPVATAATQINNEPVGIDGAGNLWCAHATYRDLAPGVTEHCVVPRVDAFTATGARRGTYPVDLAPFAVACAPDGGVWVSHYARYSFDLAGASMILEAGNGLTKLAPDGSLLGRFRIGETCTSVAVAEDGDVWAVLLREARVVRLAPDGQVKRTYAVPAYPLRIFPGRDGDMWLVHTSTDAVTRLR